MTLRPALVSACVAALIVAATTPATATDAAADLTLVVTADGAAQAWNASGAVGAGPELVGDPIGECAAPPVVDVDPQSRTIEVTVPATTTDAEVALTVVSDEIGGVTSLTPGLPDLTLTVTTEVAIVTWLAPAAADCSPVTAVFGYTAMGEPLPAEPPLAPVEPAGPGATVPAPGNARPAAVVVANPAFTG